MSPHLAAELTSYRLEEIMIVFMNKIENRDSTVLYELQRFNARL